MVIYGDNLYLYYSDSRIILYACDEVKLLVKRLSQHYVIKLEQEVNENICKILGFHICLTLERDGSYTVKISGQEDYVRGVWIIFRRDYSFKENIRFLYTKV